MKSLLVIPTLNEVDGMKLIISQIKKEWVDEIIVVDGGSTDGTIEEAKRQNLKVMMQKSKGSHGAAIFDAFESSDADYLLMFGADGNNVIHQWKQGDIIQFPPKIHHVTCNVGMVPKLTMTITGTETEKSVKLKKNGKFEI